MSNQIKSGVVLQYIQIALTIIISLVYTPIMLRTLGQSEYGIYNLSASIISYLSIVSIGLSGSYMKFYSMAKNNKTSYSVKQLNSMYLIVFIVLGFIAFIAGLVITMNIDIVFSNNLTVDELRIARILMLISTFNLLMSFPASVFTSYVISQEKFIFQKIMNMGKTVIGPMVSIPVLLLGYGSIGMVLTTTVIVLLVNLNFIYYCIRKLNMEFDFKKLDFSVIKNIGIFSSFIAINLIIDQVNWNTDKIILAAMIDSDAVAIYGVASSITMMYITFSSAISNVFIPRVNNLVTEDLNDVNSEITKLFIKVGRIQFIILFLVLSGFIFFGEYFIQIWAGENYNLAYYIILLLIIPVTIPLMQNLGIEIQKAKNMHKFRSYVYLGMAVLNVIISIVLCYYIGILGCALGTSISLIVANVLIMNVYYHKKIHINIKAFWKSIVSISPSLIIPIFIGIIVLNFVEFSSIYGFIISVFIYTIIYGISIWLFGLNNYEKTTVSNLVKSVIRFIKH